VLFEFLTLNPSQHNPAQPASRAARPYVFWRVEGSLLNLTAVRPAAFFTWNAQTFLERWLRRGTMALMALARPVLYLTHRRAATRVLHTVLRGISREEQAEWDRRERAALALLVDHELEHGCGR